MLIRQLADSCNSGSNKSCRQSTISAIRFNSSASGFVQLEYYSIWYICNSKTLKVRYEFD